VDTSLINPFIEGTAFRHAHNISSTDFLVLHSGNIGAKQGLETVVQAAHILSNQPGITFKIVGDGAAKPALMKKASHLNLPNLDFLPVQPKDKFPQVLAAADVLLVHQKGTAIESVIPSKLLTYMASARPIVAGVNPDSETAKAIMLARCGIRVDSEQPEHLAKAILSLRYDSQWRQEMGRNGRKFVEKHFSHALVLPRLEKLLKRVVASNS
jgi:colanic acid biosynthesis glycosyl transferase WcaI